MQLSKRLYHMAQYVPQHSKVADIGTDHGYLPIYLSLNNKCERCVASDINKGPLENAAKHIQKYGAKYIELRQGNGLKTISIEDKIDTIIIGGMGGYLIKDILENSLPVVKASKTLILQPQNNIMEVRQYLHTIGFVIEAETFIEDEEKYYTIICAKPGEEAYDKAYEYVYGKINLQCPNETFKKWMQHKANTLQNLWEHLEEVDTEQAKIRKAEIEQEYALHKEAMRCIVSKNL